jgi:hypothetical protein
MEQHQKQVIGSLLTLLKERTKEHSNHNVALE